MRLSRITEEMHEQDRLTSQVRIRAPTLPVPPTCGNLTKGTSNGAQENVHTIRNQISSAEHQSLITGLSLPLCPGLLGVELAPLADELHVPCACSVNGGYKSGRAAGAGVAHTKRAILEAERRVSDGLDGFVVPDTGLAGVPADTGDDTDLVLEGEASEGTLGFGVSLVPGQLCCVLNLVSSPTFPSVAASSWLGRTRDEW